jgi:enoyl-CoA hydratase
MEVLTEKSGKVCTVIINRPEVKNAVNGPTGEQLFEAFKEFDRDESLRAAVLCGNGGTFCAGADLKAVASGDLSQVNRLYEDMSKVAPMGPTRLLLSKPVIAAVSGYAVAGGLELAIWCDLRVVEEDAVFGIFERRFGVPLTDGGTQRLPRLIGMSRALDMILTGRPVSAEEALSFGLANRVVPKGKAREEAEKMAAQLSEFPQKCMLGDRRALYLGFDMDFEKAMELEFKIGLEVIASGETVSGATEFTSGKGKHGEF